MSGCGQQSNVGVHSDGTGGTTLPCSVRCPSLNGLDNREFKRQVVSEGV